MELIFDFILSHMKPIELFVFWYPIAMGLLWMIGGIIYYYRIERKDPLPLTDTPMVSILVPAYNEGDNIITTVNHLNALHYPHYEIIIINDGSSDNSPDIERQLASQYERVRFVDLKENCGKANALYLGFLAARGEYLVCVDGDSYLDPDCLRYMIPHFVNPNNGERVGAVTGNPRVRNRSSLLAKIQLCEYASIISLIKRCQRIWGKVMTVSGVVVAYRKQALLDCGLWDRDLITEDIGVTWKLERNFWDIRYEPRAICWMLVPETIKGLYKQRKRWAQGGQEVMLRHFGIFKSWRRRRLFPVYAEQVLSLTWVLSWLLLTLTEIIRLCYHTDSYIPYIWKSQYLAVICLIQFIVAIFLEKKYDEKILRNMLVAAWYPAVYWIINGLVALSALPTTLLKPRKKLATWNSPDRGIHTAQEQTAATTVEDQSHIITGQQKRWKKGLEILCTCLVWCFILVYILYCIYGGICILMHKMPVSIWIYNRDVIVESGRLLYITFILLLIETVLMIFWKEYNRRRFGGLTRRKFKPNATIQQTAAFFHMDPVDVFRMQTETIVTLPHNIIPVDFEAKPMKNYDFSQESASD